MLGHRTVDVLGLEPVHWAQLCVSRFVVLVRTRQQMPSFPSSWPVDQRKSELRSRYNPYLTETVYFRDEGRKYQDPLLVSVLKYEHRNENKFLSNQGNQRREAIAQPVPTVALTGIGTSIDGWHPDDRAPHRCP